MPKTYSRKAEVAKRYKADPRTVKRMADDGRIPPQKFYNGRYPLWDDEELDQNDRRAAAERALPKRVEHVEPKDPAA